MLKPRMAIVQVYACPCLLIIRHGKPLKGIGALASGMLRVGWAFIWVDGAVAGKWESPLAVADEIDLNLNKQMIYASAFVLIERIMWKFVQPPPKTDKVRFTFVARSWSVWESLWTQMQFGVHGAWPMKWDLINLGLVRNYYWPILTHINLQIAALWAKAEINWASDTARTVNGDSAALWQLLLMLLPRMRTRHQIDFITHRRRYRFCYILFIVSAVPTPTFPWASNGTCVLHILRQVEVDAIAKFFLRNKSGCALHLNVS